PARGDPRVILDQCHAPRSSLSKAGGNSVPPAGWALVKAQEPALPVELAIERVAVIGAERLEAAGRSFATAHRDVAGPGAIRAGRLALAELDDRINVGARATTAATGLRYDDGHRRAAEAEARRPAIRAAAF